MSHLIEEYAKSCGVKIGTPILQPTFFPISFDKYITIHHGDCNATYYDYWDEAIDILKPVLEKSGIKIIQILDKEGERINSADLNIICSKKQAAFIIKNSLCHVGTDSIYCNLAGEFNKPLLAIYSHTNPKNTRPWKFNKSKTKLLTSIPDDQRFSQDVNESPKTINNLLPEDICKNILSVLGIKKKIKFKTLLIGERFKDNCLDVIPSHPSMVRHDKINVRMDICHNEANLLQIIKNNAVEITTHHPISDEILTSRRISVINYLTDEFNEDFVKRVKSLGIHMNLLCVSKENLPNQRFKFFEHDIIFHDLKSIIEENAKKLSLIADKKIKTKSNKAILIGEKAFNSYLEALNSKDLFLLDLDWLYLYSVE